MTDVKEHGARRKLFSRAFTQTSLASWEDLLQILSTLAVSRIKRDAEGGSADILKWWTFMTSDIIAEMVSHFLERNIWVAFFSAHASINF
jgi:cytochrome P450